MAQWVEALTCGGQLALDPDIPQGGRREHFQGPHNFRLSNFLNVFNSVNNNTDSYIIWQALF